MKKFEELCIKSGSTILAALKQMDASHHKLLIVVKNEKYFNLLSIGDIQRAILKGVDLNSSLDSILRSDTKVASVYEDKQQIEQIVRQRKNEYMPIIDEECNLVDVVFWDNIFHTRVGRRTADFNLPVVIMAGGQGTRLRPLTNVLPKPLIPIGEQTMMEDIMDRFVECGCHKFYISVNYKADIIMRYLEHLGKPQYHINYLQESKPLGTAGSLHLLKDKIEETFFVCNCDCIIDEDYGEILNYHHDNKNEITVVSAVKSIFIPYGTLETGENGLLHVLQEKPELTFKINTGMYILEPHLLKEIPSNRVYHITYLIENLIKDNRRVGVYPINNGSWTDIGNWDEYLKYISKYNASRI